MKHCILGAFQVAKINPQVTPAGLEPIRTPWVQKCQSVETALLKVHNDIMCAVDSKKTVVTACLLVFLRAHCVVYNQYNTVQRRQVSVPKYRIIPINQRIHFKIILVTFMVLLQSISRTCRGPTLSDQLSTSNMPCFLDSLGQLIWGHGILLYRT